MDKRRLDVSQIFLAFMTFVGDVEKTAAALDLDPKVVKDLAVSEGWQDKIKRVCLLSKSEKPGDWERAQNRALCFVQAHRVRLVLDKVLECFHELTANEVLDKLSTVRESHVTFSSRFLSDLTSAMEKAHFLSYAALGDTVKERETREDTSDGVDANALHAATLAALNNPNAKFVPSDLLVLEASQTVKSVADQPGTPLAPIE